MNQHRPIREVARKLSCAPETLREKLRAGQLPGIKVGNEWRVDPDQIVLALSRSGGKKPS